MKDKVFYVGIDVGGTFTDFVLFDGKNIEVFKALSTPHNPASAVLDGLKTGSLPVGSHITYGTTVATNAILERKGAKTALLTTAGFEDVIEIGRQNRPVLYSLNVKKAPPLIPRDLRFGISERTLSDGQIEVPINEETLKNAVRWALSSGAESFAVCFLFSFKNPANERAVATALRAEGLFVSASSEILPEFREYERFSTTVVNAYTAPVVARHIEGLKQSLIGYKLSIMSSSGGTLTPELATSESVRTILSGPAGGVVSSHHLADVLGIKKIISLDMGGTSTDLCLSTGAVPRTNESNIGGLAVCVPSIRIHTIGAGGGSIASVDAGGALRVGPESVGSVPGPACYGRSSVPTLTDANFLLGRIPQTGLLGGRMRLDIERARKAIGTIASSLNTSVLDAAEGIVQVTDSNLERAVRVISVEKGHNPREFTLIAFGGAGPLHSANLAMRLNIKKVIIPKFPGAFSALGLLFADVVRDYSLTVFKKTEAKRGEEFQHLFEPLIKKANYEMSKGGFNLSDLTYIKSLDMRYVGQSYEINIPLVSTLDEHFHRAHRKEFSYCDRSREVEIVTIRLRVVAKSPKPRLVKKPVRPRKPVAKETEVYLNGRKRMINLYERESLCAGDLLTSPCIVTEYSATTFVPQGFYAEVDAYENIVLEMV